MSLSNIEWLEKSITDEYFNHYDYSDFKNLQPIGKGSFGNVRRVNLKNSDLLFALKSFNYDNYDKITIKNVIKEVQLYLLIVLKKLLINLRA